MSTCAAKLMMARIASMMSGAESSATTCTDIAVYTAVSGITSAITQPSPAQKKKPPECLPFIDWRLLLRARLAGLGHPQGAQHLDPEEGERDAVLADEDEDRVARDEAHRVLRRRAEQQHVEAVHADEPEEVDVILRDDAAVDLHALGGGLLARLDLRDRRDDAAFCIEHVVPEGVDRLRLRDERWAAGLLVRRVAGGRETGIDRAVSGHSHLHRPSGSGSRRRWTRSGARAG